MKSRWSLTTKGKKIDSALIHFKTSMVLSLSTKDEHHYQTDWDFGPLSLNGQKQFDRKAIHHSSWIMPNKHSFAIALTRKSLFTFLNLGIWSI